jgi:DNA-binding NarL/FixJ family response regulator
MPHSPTPTPVSLAVVDDHPLVAAGVAALVDPYRHRVRVRSYLGALPEPGTADVVFVDTVGRPDAATRVDEVIRATGAQVVVFSWAQSQADIDAAVRGGAAGYLPKTADGRGIVEAVEAVHAGRHIFSAPVPDHTAGAAWPGQQAGLTARESQILSLIVAGHSNREVAEAAWLSPNTVKTYIRTAYRKIGVKTRSQAVAWCLENGFRPLARDIPPKGPDQG